ANIPPSQIISLTNQQRTEMGLNVLEYNPLLESAARAKAEHMLANDYWAHIAPDGTEPWGFFTDSGYQYRYAGENLARDFSNPDSAIGAWMASPSHRENLLSGKYHEIGVAVVEGDLDGVDTTIIVQLFGTKLNAAISDVPIVEAKPQTVASVLPAEELDSSAPMIEVAQVVPEDITEAELISSTDPAYEEASGFKVLISPFNSTKNIALVIVGILFVILVVDGIVISRNKIPRIGGRTFAHLAFLGMITALVLIARVGQIL
ncbi:CAP domain-containing protein, partial [Patescibacteria group bacterium]|nr:CAP domain-containing protein [Patescibacteria group bacterium]